MTWLANPLRILNLGKFDEVVRTQNTMIRYVLGTADGERLLANNDGGLS